MAKNQIVTIDIGTNTVKLVQLAQTPSGLRLMNASIAHFPRKSATEEADGALISQTLEQLYDNEIQGRKPPIILSIPRLSVTTRKLADFPASATEEQLAGLVSIQAENEIPFSIEDATFDYHNVLRNGSSTSAELVAAKRESVEKQLSYLQPIGLVPIAIIPSAMATFALAQLQFKSDRSEQMTMIADVGAGHTDLCLMQGQHLIFSRAFAIGGNSLTLRYQDEVDGHFDRAERRKISRATLASETPDTVPTHEWAEQLFRQIQESLGAAVRESKSGSPMRPDELWLCGGGSQIPGLTDYLTDSLKIPTKLWNPLDTFRNSGGETDSEVESSRKFATPLAVALGMGVNAFTRRTTINLLPKEEKAKKIKTAQRQRLVYGLSATIVLILSLVLVAITWGKLHQAKITAIDDEIRILQRSESNAQKALAENLARANLLTPRISILDILRELSVRFSDRTKVAWTSFNMTRLDEPKNAKINFNIEALSHEAVSETIRVMGQSGLFSNIKSGDVISVQRGENPVFQTQIACNLSSDAIQILAKGRYRAETEQSEKRDNASDLPTDEKSTDK